MKSSQSSQSAESSRRISRRTGLLEEVGAVADRLRAGVGSEAERRSVGGAARLPLPGEEIVGELFGSELVQVDPLVGLGLGHLGDARDLDALDVGKPGAARQVCLQRLVVVLLELDARLLDRDVRVQLQYSSYRPASL